MQTCDQPSGPAPIKVWRLGAYMMGITALIRLGLSLYLPALPRMGTELHLSEHQLALTMTTYLIVFAVASIFLGPVSDRWGRRVLILGGLVAFLMGSFFCSLAHGYGLLIAGRALQGVGGSAIPIATRAMARDAFDDRQMISILGWIGAMTSLVPVLAPLLGGVMAQELGWRSNFYLLTGSTVAIGLAAYVQIPETLARTPRPPFLPGQVLRTYATMLATPTFFIPLLPVMLCFAVQGAYLVSSPFIFIHHFKLSPALFGATSLVLVAALIAGRSLCLRLLHRLGPYSIYIAGGLLTLLGGLLFLGILLLHWVTASAVLAASAIFCLGFGTLVPISMKAGLSAFPDRVGTSSALFGCLTLGATGAGSAIIGPLLNRTIQDIYSLGLLTLIAGVLVLLSSLFCRKSL